ncbi:hypothetical protein V8G54_025917 [Vigna mungo]|uniref:Uncharacterized protein n=1 Tax=Vigna mungo TaxID=3915 RepID=A0AAQ3MZA8_VIGMU
MAEGNSQSNDLLEENGASELQSLVERVGDLSPLSPKEGDDKVSKKKKKKARSKKKKELLEQTDPPSISVIDLFPSGDFPEGEIQQYKDESAVADNNKLQRLDFHHLTDGEPLMANNKSART